MGLAGWMQMKRRDAGVMQVIELLYVLWNKKRMEAERA
ncbi:MAG: hypothetical protein AVDCRST_MAG56-3892 [uncultured Cytophagales bacterium]|uniref:Uncharacterized protein n=1 Tax=uncultured Cytophagales bacterium TaxID=158755 RepID=A0A6J4JNV7_9SPHI|nr:MAG: hypothetical protein AVDCRST_MAG56-3892 [uncultured Cytophagales bacterium]